jgi:hypothetical protein
MSSLRAIAAAAIVLVVPFSARADAREHFRHGVALYDEKRYDAALEEFRAAYKEKPSAGVKQNIALCLAGLERRVEAATAFDEALSEGKDTLSPGTRAQIEQELVKLERTIATIRFEIVAAADRHAIDDASVTVDGEPVSDPLHRPVRLEPGMHTFGARADGFTDPTDKKLVLVAGEPVSASFELEKTAPLPPPPIEPREAPPPFDAPTRTPPAPMPYFVGGGLGYAAEPVHDAPLGQSFGLGGAAVSVLFGYSISRYFALSADADVGELASSSSIASVKATHWQVVPGIRFMPPGRLRFVLGTGLGLEATTVTVDPRDVKQPAMKATALTPSWVSYLGVRYQPNRLFIEPVLYADVHGLPTTDKTSQDRMLADVTTTRIGARLTLGIMF